jgi:hypothetical protein
MIPKLFSPKIIVEKIGYYDSDCCHLGGENDHNFVFKEKRLIFSKR